ncbi:MAG: alpha-ketoacid dehydrogenase subunit beta [Thaumarchaeota archaeon]|nr:alpha-ketoacid dehydrogenase subunit beta [Nitrososphaerota archaeon]
MPVLTVVQAINKALSEEMSKDESIVLLGEDIGVNGGVFRATEGLYQTFGSNRVIDTPLTESGIIGIAMGMSLYGLKPVAEIQFLDFIYPAFDLIVNELAKFRYRTGGHYTAHMVIRAPCGGGIKGGMYHSQSSETYFIHTAGLKVVMPSSSYDAKGLLIAAIRDDDPVIFLEPKRLYRSIKGEVPEGDYAVQLGRASVLTEGEDVSLFTYGAMVHVALEAAKKAGEKGISVEVVDLRTLSPLDFDAMVTSVKKTGRVVIVHEAPRTLGLGAEISAIISEKAFLHLEAPIARVTGYDTPYHYSLEEVYLPNVEKVLKTVEKTASF